MNKGVRNLLIISVCCFFLGVMIVGGCALALQIGGGYEKWLQEDETHTYYHDREQSITLDNVKKIQMALLGEPVTVQTGNVDAPIIEWEQSWDNQYTVRQTSNGTLYISREETERNNWGITWDRGNWHIEYKGVLRLLAGRWEYDWNNNTGKSNPITITLPHDHPALETVTMDSVSGQLSVNGLEIDKIDVNGVSSEVVLGDCKVDRFSVSGVDAQARIEGGETGELSADGLNVSVRVKRTARLDDVTVSGLNARFEGELLGDSSDYRFSADGMGNVLKINGRSYYEESTGWGDKRISIDGLDARIDVTFD